MRITLMLLALLCTSTPAMAKSVKSYIRSYSHLSCQALELKNSDIVRKYDHASKRKKADYERQFDAIYTLRRQKRC
ncbi:hypothetical protein ABT56_20315 [Photobacterium aquae]|uniref:Uncharacterized protein n=2 Tax=Photobacterium aquae TaxID=1195763 RepID=A0A0J1GUD7_9GAMM|nr:hypothetical protein ABT56_20315 [Photobacterium aquae]